MVKAYVLDANAVISYLEKRLGGEQVLKLIEGRSDASIEIFISAVNWGEVFYTLAKWVPYKQLRAKLLDLQPAIEIVEVDQSGAEYAAEIKHSYKLGYGDAFAAALAIQRKAVLVTADPDFEKLGRQIKLKMLPSPKRKN